MPCFQAFFVLYVGTAPLVWGIQQLYAFYVCCVCVAQILEETSSVSLHSKEIYIVEVSFVPACAPSGEGEGAGKPLEASAISFDLKLSTATFTFPEPLAKGKGTLKISFQCDINNQVNGVVVEGRETVGSSFGRAGKEATDLACHGVAK